MPQATSRTAPDGNTIAAIERDASLLGRHLTALNGQLRGGETLAHSAYLVLACLEAGGPMSITELAERIGVDMSTMNRQTAALLRDGHAERIPDPAGGIARKFRATASGQAAFDAERAIRVRGTSGILGDWNAADIATFQSLLHRFVLGIEDRTGHRWPR